MNEQEALEMMAYADQKWKGAAAVSTDKRALKIAVMVWMDALSKAKAEDVRAVLATSQEEFPPNVMVIARRIKAMNHEDPVVPSWDEVLAWMRSEAARKQMYLDTTVDLHCPWPVMEGVLTNWNLFEWASTNTDPDMVDGVLTTHYRHQYEARVERLRREYQVEAPFFEQVREAKQAELERTACAALGTGGFEAQPW